MAITTDSKNYYDIIGDIHGCADELKLLLTKLGYENGKGFYSHPEGRRVIFLGNFIDKGKKIRKTLHLVKEMCDHGTAEAVLGNHEYNALCFWELNKAKGGYLRKHSIKNILQHSRTIKQFEDDEDEWKSYLFWFMTLPLFIEKESFRVVHACWDQKVIDAIKTELPEHKLTKVYLHRSVENEYKEHRQIQTILKGWELKLPKPYHIKENGGHKNHEARVKWWLNPSSITYKDYLLHTPEEIKEEMIPAAVLPTKDFYDSKIPLFFGHYLLENSPKLQTPYVACLDYGIEKGGLLVAYRWNGEKELVQNNFVSVSKISNVTISEIS